jgi:hypothetical protein
MRQIGTGVSEERAASFSIKIVSYTLHLNFELTMRMEALCFCETLVLTFRKAAQFLRPQGLLEHLNCSEIPTFDKIMKNMNGTT